MAVVGVRRHQRTASTGSQQSTMTEEDISTESHEAYGIQQIIQLFIALVYSVIIDFKVWN